MNMLLDYVVTSVAIGMTFLYGCVGEILTEKAGHLNLGIPGIMCIGGASGCLALKAFYGLPSFLVVIFAIIASLLGGALMGAIYCFLTVTLKANQNVTGLAMTTFGVGATKFIMSSMSGASMKSYLYALKYFRFPFAQSTNGFKYWGILMFAAIAIALATSYVLNRTRVGLHLRAVGENPATADAAGINVTKYRYVSTCVGCAIASLGGLVFEMDYLNGNWEYVIDAIGWLCVALVIFTTWKPVFGIFCSIIFGAFYVAAEYIPGIGLAMKELFKMLPYVVTTVVLIAISIRNRREDQPPASLGLSYFREER